MNKINSSIEKYHSSAAEAYRKINNTAKAISKVAGDIVPQDTIVINSGSKTLPDNDVISSSKSPSLSSANKDSIVKQPLNVLRSSDVTDVVGKSSFPNFVKNFVEKKVNSIRKGDRKTDQSINQEASIIEVMSAVNEAEVALQEVVSVRDKFVNAYQELLKMPL